VVIGFFQEKTHLRPIVTVLPTPTYPYSPMLHRNALWSGLVFGLLLPAVGFTMIYQVFNILDSMGAASGTGFSPYFRERTLAIIAIALNLIPLNLFKKKRFEASMRGIVIATAVLVLIWFFYFGAYIL
jgi:hypothetical protein